MLDFTKQKKKFLTVKLDEETTILVDMPTYNGVKKLIELQNTLSEDVGLEDIGLVYDMLSDLISNNKNKLKISAEYLKDNLTIQDVATFVSHYMEFVGSVTHSKN